MGKLAAAATKYEKPKAKCPVPLLAGQVREADPELADEFLAWVDSSKEVHPHKVIASGMADLGYEIRPAAIGNHRAGVCQCRKAG